MRRSIVVASCSLLASCAHFGMEEEEGLPLGAGFRDPADRCRIVGETEFTNQFLDDSSTLVGCPEDYEGSGVFVTETGAIRVAESQGYILYTVPEA